MIVEALKTGFIEKATAPTTSSPASKSAPRPQHSFDGRIYAVAASDESVLSAAKLGAHIVMFADRPWEMRMPGIERGRALHPRISRHRAAEPDAHRVRRRLRLRPGADGGRGPASTRASSSRATSTTTSSSATTSPG